MIIAVYLALQEIAKTSLFCKIRNSIIRNNKMSKTDSLHYRLCCEGAKWMRKQEWGTYHTVAVELCTVNVENPDVWGTTGFKSMLIEVKTSRADFLKDKKKIFRTDDEEYRKYALGNKRYYLVPKGMVTIEELPTHLGLLEWDGSGISKIKEADEVICENMGEVAMLCSIMRREGVRKGIFNYRK